MKTNLNYLQYNHFQLFSASRQLCPRVKLLAFDAANL